MAKSKWVKKAVEEGKGAFKAKAEKAGKSTKEYADEKSGASGKLGKEARLAKTLMGMHKVNHSSLRKKMYGSKD